MAELVEEQVIWLDEDENPVEQDQAVRGEIIRRFDDESVESTLFVIDR